MFDMFTSHEAEQARHVAEKSLAYVAALLTVLERKGLIDAAEVYREVPGIEAFWDQRKAEDRDRVRAE